MKVCRCEWSCVCDRDLEIMDYCDQLKKCIELFFLYIDKRMNTIEDKSSKINYFQEKLEDLIKFKEKIEPYNYSYVYLIYESCNTSDDGNFKRIDVVGSEKSAIAMCDLSLVEKGKSRYYEKVCLDRDLKSN